MNLIKYILIVLIIIPIALIGQTKNQSDITSKWVDGTYDTYGKKRNGSFQKYDEAKITFQKNSDGVVFLIKIGHDKFEKWGKRGSTWVSGYSKANYACLFFTDDGKSIVRYELEPKSNTVSSAYIVYGGGTLEKEKTLKKMIDAYLEFGLERMAQDKIETAKAAEEFDKIYNISDKEIKDLKLIIIADNKDLDVGSEFKVGYEVTKSDGKVIKSENLGGKAISYNYKVEVIGAKGSKNSSYTVHQYCEKFRNKELIISVTARSKNPIIPADTANNKPIFPKNKYTSIT